MTEDKLSGLFDEIRKESAQTSISEVDQWIDVAASATATVGLLATLKLILIKKPLIMWTTLITLTSGASLGVALIFSQPETDQKRPEKEKVVQSIPVKEQISQPEQAEKTEVPIDTESPISEKPITESDSETPSLPEDLGTLIPLKLPKLNEKFGIPVYRKPQTTETFTKIHVSGALYVELSQGKACSILIEPETAKDLVKVEIRSGTLYLKNGSNKMNGKEKVVIKVCVQDLNELYMSGATSIISVQQLGLNYLNLEADGASNVNLNLQATKLKGDFSGASNVEVSGTCETLTLNVSGAANAALFELELKKARVDNSGAGNVELSITEDLKVDASGASTTSYKVHSGAKSISVDIEASGSAVIKKQ